MTTTYITIRFKREALHFWADAPEEVAFLRYPHRHEFHVEVNIQVHHEERELEFFLFKRECEKLCTIPNGLTEPPVPKSCETFARELLEGLLLAYRRPMVIIVSEDGENAATVRYTP